MRIALAQLNPTIGDVEGNTRLVIDAIAAARRDGANLLVTTELALIGYPPRDLLLREGVVESCELAVEKIAGAAGEMTVLVGHPRRVAGAMRPFYNSVSAVSRGRVLAVYDKRLLPGYDVFDEDRYFNPGQRPSVIDVAGQRVGLLLCEDMWRAKDVTAACRYPVEPAAETARLGCDLLAVLNGSPFVMGKWRRHVEQLREAARTLRLPIVSVNQVGANDDLIFDGRSVVLDADGQVRHISAGWTPAVDTIEVSGGTEQTTSSSALDAEPLDELFRALVLGVRDYCRKTGNRRVLIGLSGGIDSALTATIAAAALGAENVTGLMLPSKFTISQSREDALQLAANLGLAACPELPIGSLHQKARESLAAMLTGPAAAVTDENLQSRIRCLFLMAAANATGSLVLATSNKSELATGYCTIYGDMCGALAVLGDVLKTTVYPLSKWINANFQACGFDSAPIPQRSITRVPTAELRADQTDQDTLPPYDVLDQIIDRHVVLEQSVQTIVAATGLDEAVVSKWTRVIDREQFKREQAAIVLKTSGRTFGRGRPMPVAMRLTSNSESASSGKSSVAEGQRSKVLASDS